MKRLLTPFAVVGLALACAPAAEEASTEVSTLNPSDVASGVSAAMDRTADPCDNFYRYACGGWVDSTELPSDKARWTRSFSTIREANREFVRGLLEDAAANPGEDPNRKKVGHYYGSCMDEAAIDARGASPLESILEVVAGVEGPESLMPAVGKLHRLGVNAFFGAGAIPDFQNPDLNIAIMIQSGLGMPDRDYYVSGDEKKQELLSKYEGHVARIFGMLGDDESTAADNAATVLEVERVLAEASRERAEMRDPQKLYNKIDLVGLKELAPKLDWDAYFAATGYPDIEQINVATPEFFEAIEALAHVADASDIRTYLRWHVVDGMVNRLSSDFVNANFDFYSKTLSGQQEIEPRWKRCVSATEGALGEVLGKLYVEAKFAGSSKDVALEMIGDIESAFEAGLPSLTWMDDTTRGRAVEKVEAIANKIGFPDEWRDYTNLSVVEGDYFANTLASTEFEFDYDADKIGKPVNRNEWGMTPQMVNAYYNPLWNEIAFPAGILQPPFFHKDFPASMNYGAIGGVIGHELTHGFDDSGRKFAPDGKLVEWWEPEVSERFEERAQCVDDFYSNYSVGEGANVDGRLTLGENIADIGGVKESYAAYKAWESRNGSPESIVDGLTNDQLFFVSWGQVWCTVATEEYERLQVTTDSHSPGKFRVIGPLAQNAAFAEAFSCDPGSAMVAEEQCVVW